MRDGRVVDKQVKAAKLDPDALRYCGDGGLIGDIELEGTGIRSDAFGCLFTTLEVSRSDEHSVAVSREFPGDLKTDPLVGPGDEGDGFVLHNHSPLAQRSVASATVLC
jgi:hypothetical protein